MIKAMMPGDGEEPDVLFLGLSGENITRLVAGEPILINGAETGLPQLKIIVHYGKTEQAILDELRAHGVTILQAGTSD